MNRLLALLVIAAVAAPASAGWRCEIIKSDNGNNITGTCGKVTTFELVVLQPKEAPAAPAKPAAPAPAALKAEAVATPAASASKTVGRDASGKLIFLK